MSDLECEPSRVTTKIFIFPYLYLGPAKTFCTLITKTKVNTHTVTVFILTAHCHSIRAD